MSQIESERNAAPMVRQPIPSESLRIAWLVLWRATLIWGLALVLVVPVFRLGLTGILVTLGVPALINDMAMWLAIIAMQPLAILPIVLTMVIGKQFRGFDVVVERTDGDVPDISFREAVAPAWFLYWRVAIIAGIPLLLLSTVSNLLNFGSHMSGVPGVLLTLATCRVAYWIVVHMMFAKRFKLFHFIVRQK